MRRTLSSIGAWVVATSVAILVAWLGVKSVQKAAKPEPLPLSAAEARRLAPRTPTPSPGDNPRSTPTASPAPNSLGDGFIEVSDERGRRALQKTFYDGEAGAVTILFAPGSAGGVRVGAAAPKAGYQVLQEPRGPEARTVRLASDKRIWRLDVSLQDGKPVAIASVEQP